MHEAYCVTEEGLWYSSTSSVSFSGNETRISAAHLDWHLCLNRMAFVSFYAYIVLTHMDTTIKVFPYLQCVSHRHNFNENTSASTLTFTPT